jgi:hypothetical protein
MVKAKPATVMLGSVLAIGGGFGLYWLISKMRQRTLTLSVTPTSGTVCETTFTAKGRLTDGFGRGIANTQITIVSNEGTNAESKVTVVTGPDGSYSDTWRYSTGGQHITKDLTDLPQTLRAYVTIQPQITSPIVTIKVSAPYCSQCG